MLKQQLITSPAKEEMGHVIRQEFGKEWETSEQKTAQVIESYKRNKTYKDKEFNRLTIGGTGSSKYWLSIEVANVTQQWRKNKEVLVNRELSITLDRPHVLQLINNLKELAAEMVERGDREMKIL